MKPTQSTPHEHTTQLQLKPQHALHHAGSPWQEEERLIAVAEGLRAKGAMVAEPPVQQAPDDLPPVSDAATPPRNQSSAAHASDGLQEDVPPAGSSFTAPLEGAVPQATPTQRVEALAKYLIERTPYVRACSLLLPSCPVSRPTQPTLCMSGAFMLLCMSLLATASMLMLEPVPADLMHAANQVPGCSAAPGGGKECVGHYQAAWCRKHCQNHGGCGCCESPAASSWHSEKGSQYEGRLGQEPWQMCAHPISTPSQCLLLTSASTA